jgi:hypothetical protein
MLGDAPLSTVPMSSALEQAAVTVDAYRVWDDSAPLYDVLDALAPLYEVFGDAAPLYDVLDESEGVPDGQ